VSREIKEVEIYENLEPNDNWPYFTCPKCGNGNITRTFQRCIDCGVRLKWRIKK
jgi:predicted RNA-binding Zn-ribbon protein involved in translation (DUF1610 family)